MIDLGSGQSLHVRPNGSVALGDAVLSPGGNLALTYQAEITRTDVTLAIGLGVGAGKPTGKTELVEVLKIDLEAERLMWRVIVAPDLAFGEGEVQWQMLTARNRVLLVEDHRVLAIDARTGTQAWAFRLFAPSFARMYLAAISPELRALHIDRAVVRRREVVVHARLGDDREPTMIELDVDTGRRVYVESRRDAPVQTRLSEFAKPVIGEAVHVHDGPLPPAPPVPLVVEGYDGLAIGTALLLWNLETGRGVIVNPTHELLGEVIERARALRIADASGKQRPIDWTAIIDTAAIADSVARVRKKPVRTRLKSGAVRFDYGLVNIDAGEQVDATTLARALGSPVIMSRAELPRDMQIRLVHEPDVYTTIVVIWGPFELQDSNRILNATQVIAL